MIESAKYVMVDGLTPIIFAGHIGHDTFKGQNITSAGFVKFYIGDKGTLEAVAYGRSESLDISSAQKDSRIIEIALRLSQ